MIRSKGDGDAGPIDEPTPAATPAIADQMPAQGGTYVRQPDGSLIRNEAESQSLKTEEKA